MPHRNTGCQTLSQFVAVHRSQLLSCGIPQRYWTTLFEKLEKEMFDTGGSFLLERVEQDEEQFEDQEEELGVAGGGVDTSPQGYSWRVVVSNEEGILCSDPKQIYLLRHSWTYQVHEARRQLEAQPELLSRMTALMELDVQGKDEDEQVEHVLQQMWKFNQTYKAANGMMAVEPVWYVMEALGWRIKHSDKPAVQLVPFYYQPAQQAVSLMWPLTDIQQGEELTRDFLDNGASDHLIKAIKMLPWQPDDMTHLTYELHEEEEQLFGKFYEGCWNEERGAVSLPQDRNVCVYASTMDVHQYLSDPRFELVTTVELADIVWTNQLLKDFRLFTEENPDKWINQFACGVLLTNRQLMPVVARSVVGRHICTDTLDSLPSWLPTTFNLNTQLPQFVSYYQHREARALNNLWLCKPWNSTDGVDTHITDNLSYILRLLDAGPKMAYKYVDEPVLVDCPEVGAVKFELRFIVMLCSVAPLKLYVHHRFIVDLATKVFSCEHFDDFSKHFPSHAGHGAAEDLDISCEEFVAMFEAQYSGYEWRSIQTSVFSAIRELFEASVVNKPPRGLAHSPQSRAVYSVDVMLKWSHSYTGADTMQPTLLGCRFCPDLGRLASHYPQLVNDVFSTLFFEDVAGIEVSML